MWSRGAGPGASKWSRNMSEARKQSEMTIIESEGSLCIGSWHISIRCLWLVSLPWDANRCKTQFRSVSPHRTWPRSRWSSVEDAREYEHWPKVLRTQINHAAANALKGERLVTGGGNTNGVTGVPPNWKAAEMVAAEVLQEALLGSETSLICSCDWFILLLRPLVHPLNCLFTPGKAASSCGVMLSFNLVYEILSAGTSITYHVVLYVCTNPITWVSLVCLAPYLSSSKNFLSCIAPTTLWLCFTSPLHPYDMLFRPASIPPS